MCFALSFPGRAAVALALWVLGSLPSALGFDLQGHRGARGLAPENTLAGFERAMAIGVSTLELDVVLSAEGVPVVSHDTTPNPDLTRDATGRWLQARGRPFWHQDLATIGAWDVGRIQPASRYAREFSDQAPVDGERIPTLAAVFERAHQLGATHLRWNIETKLNPLRPDESPSPEDFARALIDTVRAHGLAERTSVQSFDWRTLQAVRRLAPDIATVHLTSHTRALDTLTGGEWTAGLRLQDHEEVPELVARAGGRVWSPDAASLTRHAIERAHRLGLRVIPWTVNEAPDMERLIDWGVDGLITDRPDRLRALMQRRHMALPPAIPVTPTRPAASPAP